MAGAGHISRLLPLVGQLYKSHLCAVSPLPIALEAGIQAALAPSRSNFPTAYSTNSASASLFPSKSAGSLRGCLQGSSVCMQLDRRFSARFHHSACSNSAGWDGLSTISTTRLRRNAIFSWLSREHHGSSFMSRSFYSTASAPSEGRPEVQDPFEDDEGDGQLWSLSEIPNIPLPALSLGLAGLIPFIALAPPIDAFLPTALFYGMHAGAQAAYGAIILTFLGGPHWGLAMAGYGVSSDHKVFNMTANSLRYLWGVVPSLLGWLALLLPTIPQLALLISSFGLVIGVDIAFARMKLVPSWYLTLRITLTTIAMLSLASNLVLAIANAFN